MRAYAIGVGVAGIGILTIGVIVALAGRGNSTASAAAGTPKEAGPGDDRSTNVLAPAAHLRIRLHRSEADAKTLLDPAAAAWADAKPTTPLLSRTPRIYQTEPVTDRPVPRCQVKGIRSNGKAYLRLEWEDATRDAPEAPPAKKGSEVLYKRPTGETSAFADAAAVMIPRDWKGPAFPSLLMGDAHAPATLYYWNASRGAEVLTASGRATPKPEGKSFPARARHADGKWLLTLEVPEPASGYPVAFAFWDGHAGDRDGLKVFSVWYVFTHE